MSDDPNKRQHEETGSSRQTDQQSGQKPGQQSDHPRDISNQPKRPSQGQGEGDDQDREQDEKGGQRRAS